MQRLESMASAQDSVPPRNPDAIRSVVVDTVKTLFEQLHRSVPPARLDPSCRLDADLGFDSLARAELLERLERALAIQIVHGSLETLDTVADVMRVAGSAPGAVEAWRIRGAATLDKTRASRPQTGEPLAASTLPEILTWRADRDPQVAHVVLLGTPEPRELSYAALLASARAIASGLAAYEVAPGATVAAMLPTSVEYLSTFFGILLAGAIPVPLYPPAHRSQLTEHLLRHAEILTNATADILVTSPEARPVAGWLRRRVRGLRHVLSPSDLERRATGGIPVAAPGTNSIALIQYTSGSTGSPKGVTLTHAQLLANIRAMGTSIGASGEDVFVSWLPLYHDMGLIGAWLGSLYFGCLCVLMPPNTFLARPARWLHAIDRYRGTLSAAPNFGYELATRRVTDEELSGVDLSSLRILFNGAEAVIPGTLERFNRRFASCGLRDEAMTPVYGLAEAGVGLAFPPARRGPLVDHVDRTTLAKSARAEPVQAGPQAASFVSCGKALPGYRLRILDPHGAEVPERTEGDLQFAGPSATRGYFRNAAATAALVSGEWRNTGDRAYLASAELYVTGRAKDVIIRRGRHFYPQDIENAAAEIEGVRRGCVAAFGVKDSMSGTERLIVVAETRETRREQRSALDRRINERVTVVIGEPADDIVLVAPHTVPKTSSGKLRRAATRAAYLDASLGRVALRHDLPALQVALAGALANARREAAVAVELAFGLYAWCALAVCAAPVFLLANLVRRPAALWRLHHGAARRFVRLLHLPGGTSFKTRADLPMPHLLVANHSSYADSLLLVALLAQPHRFVAKAELASVRGLGRHLERLRTLFIERFAPEQGAATVARIRDALCGGDAIAMFPEGTFTSIAGLRSFHLGAFQAAVAARAPVIPIALYGTRSMLRDGRSLPRRVPVRAVVGTPLEARHDEEPFAAAVRLRDEARDFILKHCGEPDLVARPPATTAIEAAAGTAPIGSGN